MRETKFCKVGRFMRVASYVPQDGAHTGQMKSVSIEVVNRNLHRIRFCPD
jgi:hypothetical protein